MDYTPNNLIAGDFLRIERVVEIHSASATVKFGTVLGKVTEGGKYKVCTKAARDGSENAVCIAAADGQAGDSVRAYFSGIFSEENIILDSSLNVDDVRDNLHIRSVFLK